MGAHFGHGLGLHFWADYRFSLDTNARSLYQRQPGHRQHRPFLSARNDGQYLAKKEIEYLDSVSVQFVTSSIGLNLHVRKFKPQR